MKAEDLRTSATHLKPPVKNLAARQRAMSCELKRPIFISSLSNPIKRPKNPASLFEKPKKQVRINENHYFLNTKKTTSMQIFSPKKYDLFNKTLREEFQSAASLIKSSKGDLKSREVQVSCMDSLNKTIENLKKEQEKYTSTTFSNVFEHSKAKDFFLSVKNNDVLKVRRLLRTYPSLVDVVNSVSPKQTQQNALHWAGQRSSAEMIESLLQAGVDWRHQDLLGRDPMKVAAKWKNPEVLQIFQTKKTEALIWAKKKTMKHVLRFNTILRSSTLKGKKF